MMDLNKKDIELVRLLNNPNISTKISIYFSTKTAGEDYDPYEKNYTFTNLNPVTIRGYVRDISPEALVWKQYGLTEIGAKEIICEDKYADWFRKANKIIIDGDEYSCYKEGLGSNALITKRPKKIIKVVVFKK